MEIQTPEKLNPVQAAKLIDTVNSFCSGEQSLTHIIEQSDHVDFLVANLEALIRQLEATESTIMSEIGAYTEKRVIISKQNEMRLNSMHIQISRVSHLRDLVLTVR
jgi:hypothetical protein